ncbi:MAG: DMT family transporter [Proteobacteria bacterium]|nr:MAG: DMT family transporter [Pseudomonadota bacterium]
MISNRNLSILLLITGSVGISFGGLIMRNINNADPWQITFYRSLAFLFSITLVLIYRHNSDILTSIKKIGYPGIAAGFFLMIAQILYVQSFAHTSIANALFTFSTIPFISAFLAFIFLKEKISTTTIVTMFFAFIGIFIMIKDGLETGGFYGNIIALICAFSFSTFVIILRKSRNNDMLPVNLISSVLVLIVSFAISLGEINVPIQDILLCFLWGGVLSGFVHSVFVYSTRFLQASEATLFMLLEFSLGPFWVWIFLNETITQEAFYGGIIVMLSVAVYSFFEIKKTKFKAISMS